MHPGGRTPPGTTITRRALPRNRKNYKAEGAQRSCALQEGAVQAVDDLDPVAQRDRHVLRRQVPLEQCSGSNCRGDEEPDLEHREGERRNWLHGRISSCLWAGGNGARRHPGATLSDAGGALDLMAVGARFATSML